MKNPLFVTVVVALAVYAMVGLLFGAPGTHFLSYAVAILTMALEVFAFVQAALVWYLAKEYYDEMPADVREKVMSRLYSLHIRSFDHHQAATKRQLSYFGVPILIGILCSFMEWHIVGALFVLAFFGKAYVMNLLYQDVQRYIAMRDLEKKGE